MKKSNAAGKLPYKKPLLDLAATLLLGLVTFYRAKIYPLLGIEPQQFVDDGWDGLIGLLLVAVLIFLVFKTLVDFALASSRGADMREKQKLKRSKAKGKQYVLDDIAKMLETENIIELYIKTPTNVIRVGASSDCEAGSLKFFDKVYYIDDKEYAVGQEAPLLDDLRYICGGELITVLSIDGVKER